MDFVLEQSDLSDLAKKIERGTRLEPEDALRLFRTPNLNALGRLATLATEAKVGNRASYIVNRYINYSNYCILSCQFCSFSRKKRNDDGFELSIEEIVTKAKESLKLGITELHIVGGLCDFLQARLRDRAQQVADAKFRRRLTGADAAARMKGFEGPDGRQNDRQTQFPAEQFHPAIDLRDVVENPRT